LIEELHALFEDLDRLIETMKDISLFILTVVVAGMIASIFALYAVLIFYKADVMIALAAIICMPTNVVLLLYGLALWRLHHKWKERIGKLRDTEAQMLKDLESID